MDYYILPREYADALYEADVLQNEARARLFNDPVMHLAFVVRNSDAFKTSINNRTDVFSYEKSQVKWVIEKARRLPNDESSLADKVQVLNRYREKVATFNRSCVAVYDMPAYKSLLELEPNRARALELIYAAKLVYIAGPATTSETDNGPMNEMEQAVVSMQL